MKRRVKFMLLLFIFCLSMAFLLFYQLGIIGQRKQEVKFESEIVREIEEVKEEIIEVKEEKTKIKEEKTKIKEDINKKLIVEEPQLVSLGEFKITAYCPCSKCCGKWAGGNTASGTKPTVNRTIAVDTNVIPFGAEIVINDATYIAEDTGSAIKGNKIDIYFSEHNTALQFGVQYAEVFIKKIK